MSLEDVLSFKKGSKFASLLFSAFFLFVSGSEKMTMSITMTISTCYISNILYMLYLHFINIMSIYQVQIYVYTMSCYHIQRRRPMIVESSKVPAFKTLLRAVGKR